VQIHREVLFRSGTPAGNLKPAKDKSTERIDGIVALIMAIGRAMLAQEEPQLSYEMFILR
jgi:phage terminase large subunit-like protein